MGITERKERERTELKELVLLKAKEILDKEGFEKLSIRRIAKAVEYSPATIYLYFQDKDEIIYELMEMGFELMGKVLADAFGETDPVEKIRKIGYGYVRFGLENPDWYDLMFNSQKPMNHIERCQSEWGHGIGLFEYLVATCDELTKSRKDITSEPRILALQLWSTVHGLVTLAHSQRLEIVEKGNHNALITATIDNSIHHLFSK
ncbi:MAG: TetR/AcrR family transcriptional regulator [Saprospiraceae bacterium]|nr:TetR/AcrR family transcriptional regulator [Saprospiraceae bacterium]